MYYKYNLNSTSSWNNLPWKKIYFKILVLKKKIFQATKQYNFKEVYKIQKYLLNSNEAKLFAIENVLKKNNLYNIEDKEKFFIFKYLYYLDNNKNIKIYLFIEQIKQYLIYLCIDPEWQAKSVVYLYKIDLKKKNTFFYYIDQYIFNNNYNIKYTSTKFLINKIKSSRYIHNTIKYWLYNNYYINLINTFNIVYKNKDLDYFIYKKNILINKYFSNLIYSIYLLGLDWYLFYLSLSCYNCKTKNIFDITTYSNIKLYKYIIYIIKLNLYTKNISYKLNKIMERHFYKYLKYLYINEIELIYKKINSLLYYWYKKKCNIIFYKYNRINNYYLNIFLYSKKNKNNYKKLLF